MTETTAIETHDGFLYLVELDETAGTVTFTDGDTDAHVITLTTATLATVTGALALDLGAGRHLDTAAVAELRQWVRI